MPPPAAPTPSRPRTTTTPGVRAVVTAFGKHPAWQDQIDPATAGTTSPLLEIALRRLYTDGLARACAAGMGTPSAIDRIPATKRLAGFGHTVHILHPDGGVVGRLWNSRDALARTGSPMGVVASLDGAPADLGWLSENVLPRLAAVEQMVGQTKAPELVRLALGEAARQVEDTLVMQVGRPRASVGPTTLLQKLTAADAPGVARLLAQLDQAITASAGEPVRIALTLRLASPLQDQSARAWAELVQDTLRERFPQRTSELPAILALHPHGAPFVDLFVGPAGPDKWAVTRADQTHAPIAHEPATPSPEQLERIRLMTQRWSRAAKDEAAVAAQPTRDAIHDRPSKRGVTILALGGVVLAATTVGLLISRAGGKDSKPQNPILIGGESDPAARAQNTPPSDATDAGTLRQRLDREARALSILTPKTEDEDAPALARANEALQALRTKITAGERGASIEQGLDALAQQRTALERQLRERSSALVEQAKAFAAALKQPALRTAAEDRVRAWASEDDPKQLRTQLASFREAMTLADTSLASATGTDPTQGVTGLDVQALRATWQSLQADSARAIAQAATNGNSGKVRELAQELSAWRASATSFLSDAQRVQAGLDAGAMLDEPLPVADGGEAETAGTLRELARRARASRVQQDVPGLIDGALRRVDRLADIQASADRAELDALLRTARADTMTLRASESREAFERVLAQVGNDAAGVREAREALTRDVLPTLARIPSADRAAALRVGATRGLLDAWATRVRASETNRPALRELLALAPELGVDQEFERTLPTSVRRALAEDRLAGAVTKAGKDDAQVARAAADFLAAIRELPTGNDPQPRDELEALCVAAQPGVPTPVLLSKLGPASAGWTLLTHDAAGAKLVFEKRVLEKQGGAGVSSESPRLAFERQASVAGDESVTYLATTELSVGAMLAIANDPATSDKVLPLLWQFTPGVSDPRDGPRSWEWTDASKRALRVPDAWLRPLPIPRTGAYAEGLSPGAPSTQSPAQYLSPQASEAIAAAMGCRLPTAEEWLSLARAACSDAELLACGGSGGGANLRDATWAQQAAHVQSKGTSTVALPAAGLATPDGAPKLASAKDLSGALTQEDGELWFWPVAVGPALGATPFVNAVGNVAEWVRVDEAGTYAIAGGSALSALGSSQDLLPRKVTDPQASRGFSDVGVRLAFDAPASAGLVSPADALRSAIAAMGEPAASPDVSSDADANPNEFRTKLPSPPERAPR